MLDQIKKKAIPNEGKLLAAGLLPEYFYKNSVAFTYEDGTPGKTAHVRADNISFNAFEVCGATLSDFTGIWFDQLSYKDTDGNVQIVKIPQDKMQRLKDGYTFGYITKLNNQRWGFKFTLDFKTGNVVLKTDIGSPIIGILYHFDML